MFLKSVKIKNKMKVFYVIVGQIIGICLPVLPK